MGLNLGYDLTPRWKATVGYTFVYWSSVMRTADQIDTNINSQNVALENVKAAESAIRDADVATEAAALTRAQILVKSTTSILGVANQIPQNTTGQIFITM